MNKIIDQNRANFIIIILFKKKIKIVFLYLDDFTYHIQPVCYEYKKRHFSWMVDMECD